jgi:tonB-dependent receptor plug domain protein
MWQAAAFKDHLDYWRPETDTNLGPNTNAFYPRPLFGAGGKNFQTSDRYLQNAAYMRIKNIQLGYTLPAAVASKIGASRIRFYFSAENLATFTKMNKIFDPEATGGDWGPGKLYPLQRTISFGLNLNF